MSSANTGTSGGAKEWGERREAHVGMGGCPRVAGRVGQAGNGRAATGWLAGTVVGIAIGIGLGDRPFERQVGASKGAQGQEGRFGGRGCRTGQKAGRVV